MPFKKGQSGNPGGRKKADPEIKALQELSSEQFKEFANLLLMGKRQEATDLINNVDAPIFKRWLAKMADQGLTRCDQQIMEFFLNRLIGKVSDKTEHSGTLRLEDIIAGGLKGKPE